MSFYLRKEFLPGELVNGKPMVAVAIDDTDQDRRSYFSSIVEAKAYIENQVRAEGRLGKFEIDKAVEFNSKLDAQWLIEVPVAVQNRWRRLKRSDCEYHVTTKTKKVDPLNCSH